MFSGLAAGDLVVLCSGKPHFHRERRKVTYVNKASKTIEVAGAELFDMQSGHSKLAHRGAAMGGARRIFIAEGAILEEAVVCEVTRSLANLQLRVLKKLPKEDLLAAARLLGVL